MSADKETPDKDEKNPVVKHQPNSDVPEYEVEEVVNELKKNPKLKDLSEEQLKEIAEISIIEVKEESLSGPLPPPLILEGYERTLMGAANRIIVMAEDNAKNRHEINHKIVDADIKRSKLGQILGFILSILFIGAAIVCSYLNQPFPASILGVGGFSSIISIFVLGKK
jgi:uncharacterized membrane protein